MTTHERVAWLRMQLARRKHASTAAPPQPAPADPPRRPDPRGPITDLEVGLRDPSPFKQGHAAGWKEGHDAGWADGYQQGRADGYTNGWSDGYAAGLTDGARARD